jgi:nucleosome assembly protein 1-like 1
MAKEKVLELEEEIEEEDEEEVEPWPEDDDEEDEDDDEEEDEDDDDEEERLSREEFDEQVLTPEGIRPMSQRGIEMWEEYNNQF